MPCSHCRQKGHNIRTCPVLNSKPTLSFSLLENVSEKSLQENISDKKSVRFSDPIHTIEEIPILNSGKKVKYTPSRPRVRSRKSKSIRNIYFLASQGNIRCINQIILWKKYC